MIDLFSKIRHIFPQSKFARNVTLIASGTAFGQGILVLASPLLTRLYSPEDFGILAVFSSILSILAVLASLRYELAIPLPTDNKAAATLLAGALGIAVGTSLLACFAVLFFGERVAIWAGVPALRHYLWFLPISLLGAGAFQCLSYWSARQKNFSLLGYVRALQATGRVIVQIFGGILHFGVFGLISGVLVAQFLGVGTLLRKAYAPLKENSGEWGKVLKRYSDFPKFTVWASLISVIGVQFPPILFTRFFSPEIAGYFLLITRVLTLPAALIGQATGQVFFPLAAEKNHDLVATRTIVQRVSTTLFKIAFPIFALIGLQGETIFRIIFGESWGQAGRYAQYFAPWLLLSFVSSPLSPFVLAKGRQKQALWITFYETTLRLGVVWLGGSLASPGLAMGMFAGVGVIISLVYIAWILHLSGSGLMEWARGLYAYLLSGISIVLVLSQANHLFFPVQALVLNLVVWIVFGIVSLRSFFRGELNG